MVMVRGRGARVEGLKGGAPVSGRSGAVCSALSFELLRCEGGPAGGDGQGLRSEGLRVEGRG